MSKFGKLDRRIVIEQRTTTANDFNEPIQSWVAAGTISAAYMPGSGSERRIAAQETGEMAATFRVHSSTLTKAIKPNDYRINFDGGLWDIIASAAPDRGRFIEITARRRTT